MERWRWETPDLDQRYIWINVPSFQLHVIDKGQTILESRIIVGKPESPTPVLNSLVECITLYPYWYIPRKIAIEEYLPEIQKDTSFLMQNNFDVLDRKGNILDPATLDWQRFTTKYFPVSLRQREGSENSLGVIKFIFDNPYAVFLHDTNTKSLFRKKTRMFSHGCIRMEKAIELANYLTRDPKLIESKLQLKERWTINLDNPIAIYTRYFTCEYIHDELNFYDDIYGLDQAIIDTLYNQWCGN
jgi:murein L,D-transpeptidase YcbB/YkuD